MIEGMKIVAQLPAPWNMVDGFMMCASPDGDGVILTHPDLAPIQVRKDSTIELIVEVAKK